MSTLQGARLYSTKFVRVLFRAHVPFVGSWVMELLTLQLYDQSKAVAMEAISVISEACEELVSGSMFVSTNRQGARTRSPANMEKSFYFL